MKIENENEIKRKKGEFWSKPGAADVYEKNVMSESPIIQIKNLTEREWVQRHAFGNILDAGTGTGRFAIKLAEKEGNTVTALDFSDEMLKKAKEIAETKGIKSIKFQQGDVENLPFKDEQFDSVVSITVVRHLPQWKSILKEYSRVLKSGGILVFEMCSGDHIELANKISNRFGTQHSKDGYLSYETEINYSELNKWLELNNLEITNKYTYDYFNQNCFIKIIGINEIGYKIIMKCIRIILKIPGLIKVWSNLEAKILYKLPTYWSYNYMIVCRKR